MRLTRLLASLIICGLAHSAGHAAAQSVSVEIVGEDHPAAFAEDLVSKLSDETPPESRFEARRQAQRAINTLTDYLNSEGYFAPILEPVIDPGPPITASVRVTPGPRFTIGDVAIEFVGDPPKWDDLSSVTSRLDLKTGDFAEPAKVLAAERTLISALKNRGYAFAKAEAREVLGDEQAATIDVIYRLSAGARVRFGPVNFGASTRLRRTFADRLIPFQRHDLYTPQALSEFNRRLGETRLYSVYTAQLDPIAREHVDGDAVHDITVTLVERDRFTIGAGASFSTDEGPGLTIEWTRRNATRRGDRLKLTGVLAQQQRSLSGEWSFPNALGYGRSLRLNGFGGFDETDAFDRTSLVFGTSLDIKRSPILTYALGGTSEFSRETDTTGERDLWILSVSGAAGLDLSDDLLDPSKGWRAEVRAEPGTVIGDEQSNFVSLLGAASAYRAIDPDKAWVAAVRARMGSVFGADTLELPTSRRFFAGGGGSARGFAYQSIGPKDDTERPIGGRGLFETSAELRWRRSDNLGFAVFVDGAAVTTSDVPTVDDMRFGAGIGVRYYTAIGPIRFDLATPLSREDGDDPVQIYISIGQAF